MALLPEITRYAKSMVAHASGMPGTFSPPSQVSDPTCHDACRDRYSVVFFCGENVPSITSARTTHNFTYLARGPWNQLHVLLVLSNFERPTRVNHGKDNSTGKGLKQMTHSLHGAFSRTFTKLFCGCNFVSSYPKPAILLVKILNPHY